MANITFGFGTSHSPLLSTPPDKWHLRVEADKKNQSLEFRGETYVYDQLVTLRKDEGLDYQSSLAVRTERHAKSRNAINKLADSLERANPDVLIIIGNDQKEVFGDGFTPAFSMLCGESIDHKAIPPERLAKMPPGIAIAALGCSADEDITCPLDQELSTHILSSLTRDQFDMTAIRSLPTHPGGRGGMAHAYGFIYKQIMRKPIPAVHVCINTFYPPNQPTARRCVEIGQAIGRAIRKYPHDINVAVCGSGGLSHFVIDEQFDEEATIGLINLDMAKLSSLREKYFRSGTSEIKNWITTAAIAEVAGLKNTMSEYIPCYRSEAGTGNAMGFMTWKK